METTNLWVKGGVEEEASFRTSYPVTRGLRPASPVQWCHPWQSSVCTTCGWSVSPSWVSQLSPRPGKSRWGEFHS